MQYTTFILNLSIEFNESTTVSYEVENVLKQEKPEIKYLNMAREKPEEMSAEKLKKQRSSNLSSAIIALIAAPISLVYYSLNTGKNQFLIAGLAFVLLAALSLYRTIQITKEQKKREKK
jgi:hypothetical protein